VLLSHIEARALLQALRKIRGQRNEDLALEAVGATQSSHQYKSQIA
jgi:hypothetical protein